MVAGVVVVVVVVVIVVVLVVVVLVLETLCQTFVNYRWPNCHLMYFLQYIPKMYQ